jgi:hypothetical protein
LQGCAMHYRLAPWLLGWTCRFCTVRGWSRHDLAMTWERYASSLHLVYTVFGDFRPKLEAHMHVSFSDLYVWFINMCSIMYQVARCAMPSRPTEYIPMHYYCYYYPFTIYPFPDVQYTRAARPHQLLDLTNTRPHLLLDLANY